MVAKVTQKFAQLIIWLAALICMASGRWALAAGMFLFYGFLASIICQVLLLNPVCLVLVLSTVIGTAGPLIRVAI